MMFQSFGVEGTQGAHTTNNSKKQGEQGNMASKNDDGENPADNKQKSKKVTNT